MKPDTIINHIYRGILLFCLILAMVNNIVAQVPDAGLVPVNLPVGEQASAVFFEDDSIGYLATELNRLYFTQNRGATWNLITDLPSSTVDMEKVDVPNNGQEFLFGWSGDQYWIASGPNLDSSNVIVVTPFELGADAIENEIEIFDVFVFEPTRETLLVTNIGFHEIFESDGQTFRPSGIPVNRRLNYNEFGYVRDGVTGNRDFWRITAFDDPIEEEGVINDVFHFVISDGVLDRVVRSIFPSPSFASIETGSNRIIYATQANERTSIRIVDFTSPDDGYIALDPLNTNISVLRNSCEQDIIDPLYCDIIEREPFIRGGTHHFTNNGGDSWVLRFDQTFTTNGNAAIAVQSEYLDFDFDEEGNGFIVTEGSVLLNGERSFNISSSPDRGAQVNNLFELQSADLPENLKVEAAGQSPLFIIEGELFEAVILPSDDPTPPDINSLSTILLPNGLVQLRWFFNGPLTQEERATRTLEIERRAINDLENNEFDLLVILPSDTPFETFMDDNASNADTIQYEYRIRINDGFGFTNFISSTYPLPPTPLTPGVTETSITFQWEDNTLPGFEATSYRITVPNTTGGNQSITVPGTETNVTFLNNNLSLGTGYTIQTFFSADDFSEINVPGVFEGDWMQNFGFSLGLLAIDGAGPDSVWAVGREGRIYFTPDRGANWSIQNNTDIRTLFDVFMLNGQVGWATGQDGLVLRTINGGQVWTPTEPTTENLSAIHFFDENIGVSAGNAGVILNTTNGGDSWETTIFPDRIFFDVFSQSPDVSWVAGFGGILFSDNGGSSYVDSFVPSDPSDTIKTITFINESVGLAAGNNGFLIRTTDAGNTWVPINNLPIPVGTTINDIHFSDENVGYLVGENGVLLESFDAGLTWAQVTSPDILAERNSNFIGVTQGILNFNAFALTDNITTSESFVLSVGVSPVTPVLEPFAVLEGTDTLILQWNDNPGPVGIYELQRAFENGAFVTIADRIPASQTQFFDTNFPQLGNYRYRIRAINENGASPFSEEAQGTTGCTPLIRPESFTGNVEVCAGNTEVYSIEPVNGAESYIWQIPEGSGVITGLGDTTTNPINNLMFTNNLVGPLTISVSAFNSCFGASQPIRITIISPEIFAENLLISPTSSTDISEGELRFTPSGGQGNTFTFDFNGEMFTSTEGELIFLDTLSFGDFSISVTDEIGCAGEINGTVGLGDVFSIRVDTVVNSIQTLPDPSVDYSVQIDIQGGLPPYDVSFGSAAFSIQNTDTLINSVITSDSLILLTLVDSIGSITDEEVELVLNPQEPICPPLDINVNSSVPPGLDCRDPIDQIIEIVPTVAGNYSYSVDGGFNFQLGNTFTLVENEQYEIIVQDLDRPGCFYDVTTISTPVNGFIELELIQSSGPTDCDGDGFADIAEFVRFTAFDRFLGQDVTDSLALFNDGVSQFFLSIQEVGGSFFSADSINNGVITGLPEGIYDITATNTSSNAGTCRDTIRVDLTQRTSDLQLELLDILNPVNAVDSGNYTVLASGGFAPREITRNFGTSILSDTLFFQGPGNQSDFLEVEDSIGCVSFLSVILSEPFALQTSFPFIFCDDDPMEAMIEVNSDVDYYSFSLDSGQTFTGLGFNTDTIRIDTLFFGIGPDGTPDFLLDTVEITRPFTITGLQPGNNRVDISGARGSSFSLDIFVQDFRPEITLIQPSCEDGTGQLRISQPFEISYERFFLTGSDGSQDSVILPEFSFITDTAFFNLISGVSSTLSATPAEFSQVDCDLNEEFFVEPLSDATSFDIVVNSSTCPGENDASIEILSTSSDSLIYVLRQVVETDTLVIDSVLSTNGIDFLNLTAGEYLIDANSPPISFQSSFETGPVDLSSVRFCTVQSAVIIREPEIDFDVEVIPSNVACAGEETGEIFFQLIDIRNEAFLFSIDGGNTFVPGLQGVEGFIFSDLAPGTYNTVVSDASNCRVLRDTVTITAPDTPLSLVSSFENGEEASITLEAIGGVPFSNELYDFQISGLDTTILLPSANNFTIDSLSRDLFTTIATDSAFCQVLTTIDLRDTSQLFLDVVDFSPVLCTPEETGFIEVSTVGGTAPFEFLLNEEPVTLQGDSILTGLDTGDFILTVFDANGNTANTDVLTIQRSNLSASFESVEDPLCFGEGTGEIILTIVGDQELYDVSVNNQEFQMSDGRFSNLILGTYNFRIRNELGCEVELDTVLFNPEELELFIGAANDPGCFGEANGNIMPVAVGGTGEYTYVLNGDTIELALDGFINNLPPGSYQIQVFDENSCESNIQEVELSDDNSIFVESRFLLPDTIALGDSIRLLELVVPEPDSVFWNIESLNQTFSGDTIIRFDEEGTFLVTLSGFFGGCSAVLTKDIVVSADFESTRGRFSNFAAVLNSMVSPNPSDGIFNLDIELTIEAGIELMVTDNSGIVVFENELQESQNHTTAIDLSSLPSGTYFLRVRVDSGFTEFKRLVLAK